MYEWRPVMLGCPVCCWHSTNALQTSTEPPSAVSDSTLLEQCLWHCKG